MRIEFWRRMQGKQRICSREESNVEVAFFAWVRDFRVRLVESLAETDNVA